MNRVMITYMIDVACDVKFHVSDEIFKIFKVELGTKYYSLMTDIIYIPPLSSLLPIGYYLEANKIKVNDLAKHPKSRCETG